MNNYFTRLDSKDILFVFIILILFICVSAIVFITNQDGKEDNVKEKINALADNSLEITPEELQAVRVFDRVNNHFSGRGNGDVYADYKYGDEFTIKMIALESSGFRSLDELERNTILTYDAYSKGYNKTRGNRG